MGVRKIFSSILINIVLYRIYLCDYTMAWYSVCKFLVRVQNI